MNRNIISTNSMNKGDLKNLTKSQFINLLLKQNSEIKELLQQNAKPETEKLIPDPPKSVKQMVQDYEENIILPPVPKPRTMKPIPQPRTKIEQLAKALKSYTKSFEIF